MLLKVNHSFSTANHPDPFTFAHKSTESLVKGYLLPGYGQKYLDGSFQI